MNEVRLKGRVAKDFECRGESGKEYCFFAVACDREYSAETDFIDVKAFGDLAVSCSESLKKGDLVSVTGRLGKSSYEKDGKKIYTTSVIADGVAKIRRTTSNVASRVVEEIEEPKTLAE